MINWFNMPAEGLSNGGQFEIKELTATENKTYEKDGEVYNKVTVNVEGGGGGSSDFSIAKVTIIAGSEDIDGFLNNLPILESDSLITSCPLTLEAHEQTTVDIALYKGKTIVTGFGFFTVDSMSGNIVEDDDENYIITGDCSITLLPAE